MRISLNWGWQADWAGSARTESLAGGDRKNSLFGPMVKLA